MAQRRTIPGHVQDYVRDRARGLCEYCRANERWQYVRFTIDHVVPLAQSGDDSPENLALACFHCNRKKWNDLAAVDPTSGITIPLYNPRSQTWLDHFAWTPDHLQIVGLTDTGRVTVVKLELNRPRAIDIRAADILVGRHPPNDKSE